MYRLSYIRRDTATYNMSAGKSANKHQPVIAWQKKMKKSFLSIRKRLTDDVVYEIDYARTSIWNNRHGPMRTLWLRDHINKAVDIALALEGGDTGELATDVKRIAWYYVADCGGGQHWDCNDEIEWEIGDMVENYNSTPQQHLAIKYAHVLMETLL